MSQKKGEPVVFCGSNGWHIHQGIPVVLKRVLDLERFDSFNLPLGFGDIFGDASHDLYDYGFTQVRTYVRAHGGSHVVLVPENKLSQTPEGRRQAREIADKIKSYLGRDDETVHLCYVWRDNGELRFKKREAGSGSSAEGALPLIEPRNLIGLIGCGDYRLREIRDQWIAENLGEHSYCFAGLPGGAKPLCDESVGGHLSQQIFESFKIERVQKVVIMTHEDCAAYSCPDSYVAKFANSHAAALAAKAFNPSWDVRIIHIRKNGNVVDWTY